MNRPLSALTASVITALAHGIIELRQHPAADVAIAHELAVAIDAMADLLELNRSMLEVMRDILLRCAPNGGEIDATLIAQIEAVVHRVEGGALE